jgi:hypothetical protein
MILGGAGGFYTVEQEQRYSKRVGKFGLEGYSFDQTGVFLFDFLSVPWVDRTICPDTGRRRTSRNR